MEELKWTFLLGFHGGSVVKNLSANSRDAGLIPGPRRPPGGENGNSFLYLARKIPWREQPDRLQPIELQSQTRMSN